MVDYYGYINATSQPFAKIEYDMAALAAAAKALQSMMPVDGPLGPRVVVSEFMAGCEMALQANNTLYLSQQLAEKLSRPHEAFYLKVLVIQPFKALDSMTITVPPH